MGAGRLGRGEASLLLLITGIMVVFGLIMVFSSSSAAARWAYDDSLLFFKRQLLWALAGIATLLFFIRFNYRRLAGLAFPLLIFSLILLVAVLIPGIGSVVNGARRWILLGPVQLQPADLFRFSLVLFMALQLSKRRLAPWSWVEIAKPYGVVIAAASLLVLLQPDLGSVLSMGIAAGLLLFLGGVPGRKMGQLSAAAFALVLLAIVSSEYRRERLLAFLNPWADARDSGFQIVQSMIAFGSGGVLGVGPGNGIQKYNYLPEAHTDMIFSIVGEELGLIGVTAVLGFFLAIGYLGLRIALRAKEPFGTYLAAGLTTLLISQAGINLGAVMGILPLTGIPLPFISYGGSSLVVSLASIGVLVNIATNRRTHIAAAPGREHSEPADSTRRRRHGGARNARTRAG